jgi:hypothetical protein
MVDFVNASAETKVIQQIANINSAKTSNQMHYPFRFNSKCEIYLTWIQKQTNLPIFKAT